MNRHTLLVVLLILLIASTAYAANCALRNPDRQIYEIFPEATNYRSVVSAVGVEEVAFVKERFGLDLAMTVTDMSFGNLLLRSALTRVAHHDFVARPKFLSHAIAGFVDQAGSYFRHHGPGEAFWFSREGGTTTDVGKGCEAHEVARRCKRGSVRGPRA